MLKLKSLNTRDALRAAATKGCLEAVRFFVEEGVDKDAADKEGNTPVMLASQKNHQAIVQFLEQFKTDKKKADMSLKLKSANTRCITSCNKQRMHGSCVVSGQRRGVPR